MAGNAEINRKINIFNLVVTILVLGAGLILFLKFHIGDGAFRAEWLGLGKIFWLTVHQVVAIGFLVGCAAHLQMHWKYIKAVSRKLFAGLSVKARRRTLEQILLLIATMVVLCAGFYPWIVMPGAGLHVRAYHNWIDVHNMVGLLLVIGMIVHIKRRLRRVFRPARRNSVYQSSAV